MILNGQAIFPQQEIFLFSKANMDYIYAADADEVLDDFNHERFLRLKNALLPEIEIVQMKYVTDADFDTVLNAKKEYRPKLFKRLRTFTWVDPVHETVRLTPVILTVTLRFYINRRIFTANVIFLFLSKTSRAVTSSLQRSAPCMQKSC